MTAPLASFLAQLMPGDAGAGFVSAAPSSRFAPTIGPLWQEVDGGAVESNDSSALVERSQEVAPQAIAAARSAAGVVPAPVPGSNAPHREVLASSARGASVVSPAAGQGVISPHRVSARSVRAASPISAERDVRAVHAWSGSPVADEAAVEATSADVNEDATPDMPIRPQVLERRGTSNRERPTVVNVTIDRIEVRAPARATAERQPQKKRGESAQSLADYLRQRGGGASSA